MKKTLLSLAIAATAVAGSVNAAEIYNQDGGSIDFYGQLRTEMTFKDADNYSADLDTGSSRTGVNASYNVAEGFDVIANLELGVNTDDDVSVRNHLFGFATDYGTVTFGKSLISSDDVGGTDYSYFFGGSGNLYGTLNGAWNDSRIKYQLDLGNWWVNATYGLNDSSSNQDLAEAFVGAKYGDLAFHVGGGRNRTHDMGLTANENGGVADLSNTYYEATVMYDILSNLQVSGTYYGSQIKDEDGGGKIDSNSVSVGAYWTFMEKTSLYAGYEYTKGDASNVAAFNDPDADGDFTNTFVGVEYKFSKWARVFAEAGFSDGETVGYADTYRVATGPKSDTNFGLGARFYW